MFSPAQRFLAHSTSANCRKLLTSMPARSIASIRPTITQSSIFMAETYPAKLSVPITPNGQTYEFTISEKDTVQTFEDRIKQSLPQLKNSFSLNMVEEQKTMKELVAGKFDMTVNGHEYKVYPNLRSIILMQQNFKNEKALEDFNEANTTMSVTSQIVTTEFLEKVIAQTKNKKKDLTKTQIEDLLNKAITSYSNDTQKNVSYKNARKHIDALKDELKAQDQKEKAIKSYAHKWAGMSLGAAFLGTSGQLIGMATGIYGIWDWNVVEPMTWMFQNFYMMVGSWFFFAYKQDWAYMGVHSAMLRHFYMKRAAELKHDTDQTEALRSHIEHLETCIEIFQGIEKSEDFQNQEI